MIPTIFLKVGTFNKLLERNLEVSPSKKEVVLSLLLELLVGAVVDHIFAKSRLHKFVSLRRAQHLVWGSIEEALGFIASHEHAISAKELKAEGFTLNLRVLATGVKISTSESCLTKKATGSLPRANM
jgi:hypothetical protein